MNKTIRNSIIIVIVILGLVFVVIVKFIGPLMADEARHIDVTDLYDYVEDGDIIFQTSKSSQSKAIQIATNSKYSHLGIIYKIEGNCFVYEAVQPVKLTALEEWIDRGEKRHFVIKRLKNSDKILTTDIKNKMKTEGEKYRGKNYDLYFEWSDDRIYCSELVWKIYKNAANVEIGKLQRLSEFNLKDKTVIQKLKERYGENIPKDEIVISPSSMFESEKLTSIYIE
ncbi:YiiX family permuted papain-like enzyme [Draconibacterium sediminis]|uniref:Peptidoglycan peptidase n=1 Tax=Draconibacterium sediminis TaxID=1544798 RepID=A0A0D8JDE2_9BACT|nr:YiiX family permuted papain-like enzyme [Draconibacterium sediminis]KJF43833.1 peptidoglycan peptidase [Draconibacterium sediminis]